MPVRPAEVTKVELSGVTKVFPAAAGVAETVALEGVTLSLREREIVSLVGRSGCGKTTVLNLIAGFMEPTAGRILVGGRAVTRPGPDRLVVFQSPALFPWLTVWDNITFGVRHRGADPVEYGARATSAIKYAALTGFERHYPYQLSGGMRQRVQIARCLMSEAEVLLLDEPFGALDAQTRIEMQHWLLEMHRTYDPTILFITHDVDEALFLSDRVYVMTPRPGRIQAEIAVPFPRPRRLAVLGAPEFVRLKAEILGLLHGAAMGVSDDPGPPARP
jgi:NitT/TauT family transport system ATP-binding protein